ncbi:MAG: cell division protein FtsQ/DivIB, partial [Gaiellaceae bacterium]
GLDGSGLLRGVESVPAVASATFDRAFPHTLRIVVQSEQAVAVLRRGPDSWLVSARGRILGHVRPRTLGALPRIWIRRTKPAEIGTTLPDDGGGAAARALAPLVHTSFAARVATATLAGDELDFTLRSGVEVRLGHPVDLRLKFAVARRLIAKLPAGARYLDVSVPERPVAGTDPQLSG